MTCNILLKEYSRIEIAFILNYIISYIMIQRFVIALFSLRIAAIKKQ